MINLKTATKLYYFPRGTFYKVTQHDVMIKQNTGLLEKVLFKLKLISKPPSWEIGCVYTCTESNKTFVRPYNQFKTDNWTILTYLVTQENPNGHCET